MRLCASLFRGVAAPLGCVICLQLGDVAVFSLGEQYFLNVRNAPRVMIPPPSETPPVSACKPLGEILLRKPSVYPLSPAKANVGRLCEKLKNAMRNG